MVTGQTEEASALERIDHIVVLMVENRSFDSVLGWLYDPDNAEPFKAPPRGQPFAGVSGRGLSNPVPDYVAGPRRLHYGKTNRMTSPNPDPGEEYAHVNRQLYGVSRPAANRWYPFDRPPYNLPDSLPDPAPMSGFVHDYIDNLAGNPSLYPEAGGVKLWLQKLLARRWPAFAPRFAQPDPSVYGQIMAGFTPKSLPVLSTLARQFAVCDHWFSAIPSQTFGNRSFTHCGTSHGFVNNSPVHKWLLHKAPTVFNRLDDAGRSFGIYYDPEDVICFTELLQPALWRFHRRSVHGIDAFFQQAAEGTLPDYSFIEPRLMLDNNDQHPPAGIPPFLDPVDDSSLLAGEQLIARVYEAVRNGPGWEKTLLVITYDEHGGHYDHVPPPSAVPPNPGTPAGEQGFGFDQLGVRVPAVLVSPWIEAGTVCQNVFDHSSILRTLSRRWNLPPLTERDRKAADLSAVLNRASPRPDRVEVTPRPYHRSTASADRPLNPYQKILLMLSASAVAFHRFQGAHRWSAKWEALVHGWHNERVLMRIRTQGEAVDWLNRHADTIHRAKSVLLERHD